MTSQEQNPMDDLSKKMESQGYLEEIRRILTGYNRKELTQLNKLLKDKKAFAAEISQLLPEAFSQLIESGEVNLDTIQPLVEETLKDSIKKNPRTLSDILFPIMMPAIRKAVSEDIKRMLDTVNSTLEKGFSPKRLAWRIQSIFSGKTYGEIVLSHAYIYQVKQVFLIHKETGLLLAQANIDDNPTDADLISAMLSAIKDFVQDSFRSGKENLDAIELGNFNIWIEQGPKAILAAIVEGNVPQNYRLLLKETIEGIHIDFSYELDNFQGDITVFQQDKELLKKCIQKEKKPQKKSKPIAALILILIVLGSFGYWIYEKAIEKHHFNQFVTSYNNTQGVIVTKTYKKNGQWFVYGLRDPLSEKPRRLLGSYNLQPKKVKFKMKSYYSLSPIIILKRASRKLKPPGTIILKYNYDTLFISGKANKNWIKETKLMAKMIPGIETVIFHTTHSTSNRQQKLKQKILAIENTVFFFPYNDFYLTEQQQQEFNKLIKETKSILEFNLNQDSIPVIIINSFTSQNGNANANKRIAQERANQFINLMIKAGLPPEVMVPKVVFEEKMKKSLPPRSVSFKIKYVKPNNL